MSTPTLTVVADADGRPAVEVYLGAAYTITPGGACQPDTSEYVMVERATHHEGLRYPGLYQPSLLQRDVDAQPRRHGTDLIVQGTWRSDHAVTSASCTLSCRGATAFRHLVMLFGDRVVEATHGRRQFSAPAPFHALPMRYDRAFGGTDEAEALQNPDPYDEALRDMLSAKAFYESSTYSYPRNPAGRGYVVSEASLDGTTLPNIEWADQLITLDRMVLPLERWDERPLPAGFDWYGRGWFPRAAFIDDFEPTPGDRTPAAEVALGILPANFRQTALIERSGDGFFHGVNPRLWRHRLRGDETIEITGMSPDGRDTVVHLPGRTPTVRARIEGRAEVRATAFLDLALIDAESRRLTLIWRARLPSDDPTLLHRPELQADLAVEWQQI